jgi:purine-nucleoside/S-methyl-5'-thioadenosine phosphorylase / adenosine deaminase
MMIKINNFRFIQSKLFGQNGVLHAFGTIDPGNNPESVHKNIKSCFPDINRISNVKQVHGKNAVHVRLDSDAEKFKDSEADIIILTAKGVAASVKTADCTPVLIYDKNLNLASAVHSGWKGTCERTVIEAIRTMSEEYGSDPKDLIAAIGPCISRDNYQVDAPVIDAVKKALGSNAERVLLPDGPGHAKLDLAKANRIILEQAGVDENNIDEIKMCTYSNEDMFFSYRRQGKGVPSLFHFIAIKN